MPSFIDTSLLFDGLVIWLCVAAPVVMRSFLAGFEFSACPYLPFSGVGVCVCLVVLLTESLILAQDERWRRA